MRSSWLSFLHQRGHCLRHFCYASGIASVVAPRWRSSDDALAEPPSVELSTLTLVNVGCSLEKATMADVITAAPINGYDCKGYEEWVDNSMVEDGWHYLSQYVCTDATLVPQGTLLHIEAFSTGSITLRSSPVGWSPFFFFANMGQYTGGDLTIYIYIYIQINVLVHSFRYDIGNKVLM